MYQFAVDSGTHGAGRGFVTADKLPVTGIVTVIVQLHYGCVKVNCHRL